MLLCCHCNWPFGYSVSTFIINYYYYYYYHYLRWPNETGTVTSLGDGKSGVRIPAGAKEICLSSKTTTPALEPTKSRTFSPGDKAAGA